MANATIYALLGAAPGLVIVVLTWVKGLRLESRAPTQGTPALRPRRRSLDVPVRRTGALRQDADAGQGSDVLGGREVFARRTLQALIDGARLRFEDAPPGG